MSDLHPPNGGYSLRGIYELLKEIDKRYEQQFTSQADAMDAADKRYEQRFLAQESAVQTALVGQEKAVAAALAAQKEAVSKAEIAADKRFDSFTELVSSLTTSRDSGAGRSLQARELIAWAIGIIGVLAYFWKASGH